ncbi:MAG TPA: hypothetical protein RMG45_05955, partial [Polyangiaceae bacterium LLY-WYZ-15_(1-7)]|nr:hypothetical protein [Polyangiaceae bacterium LLY-WYZ-15_(1-7)]
MLVLVLVLVLVLEGARLVRLAVSESTLHPRSRDRRAGQVQAPANGALAVSGFSLDEQTSCVCFVLHLSPRGHGQGQGQGHGSLGTGWGRSALR